MDVAVVGIERGGLQRQLEGAGAQRRLVMPGHALHEIGIVEPGELQIGVGERWIERDRALEQLGRSAHIVQAGGDEQFGAAAEIEAVGGRIGIGRLLQHARHIALDHGQDGAGDARDEIVDRGAQPRLPHR